MKLFKILGGLLIGIAAISLVVMFKLSYQDCLALIVKITGYNKPDRIASLLTERKYLMLQFSPIAGIILGSLMIMFSRKLGQKLGTLMFWFECVWVFIKDSIIYLPLAERVLLWSILFIGLFIKVYLAYTFPITYDEAWTYINFTQKGIAASITYYPAPNNHIFFSVLTNLLALLPIKFGLVLRIPALLAQTFFLMLFYIYCRKLFDYKVSITLLTICTFLFPLLYYGFVGRGYIFIVFFFVVNYFIVVKIITGNAGDIPKNFFLFSLSAILGFYTMPSYLYPYVTLNLFMLLWSIINKDTRMIVRLVGWGIFTAFFVIVLYTPVFIISGVKAVVANGYVVPISRSLVLKELFPSFADIYALLFYSKLAFPAALLICGLAVLNKPYRNIAMLNLFIVVFSLLIPVLHSVIAFSRTWIFLLVPVLFSLGILLDYIIGSRLINIGFIIPVLAIILFAELGCSYKHVLDNEQESLQAVGMNDFLLRKQVRSVYIQDPLSDAYVLFAFKENATAINCFVHESDLRDTANKIDMMVYQKSKMQELLPAKPVFQNDYVAIYQNPAMIQRRE